MKEAIIKTASTSEWQKWLNQWRHDYKIEIFLSSVDSQGFVTIGLWRSQ